MVDRKLYNSPTASQLLCETYSTEHLCLKQIETDTVYDSSVIDVIVGYDENGKPYSRFTYIETEEVDEYAD